MKTFIYVISLYFNILKLQTTRRVCNYSNIFAKKKLIKELTDKSGFAENFT